MPAPTTKSTLAPIDAFRGLAALWVAAYHYWQWPQPYFDDAARWLPVIRLGDKAVPVFVILSGFLIWRSVRSIRDGADLTRYMQNRFLRLYPLYAVVTLVVFVAGF